MPRATGRKRLLRPWRAPAIPRKKLQTGVTLHIDALPTPEELGVGSTAEVKVYLVLIKWGIPFSMQWNFDGGEGVPGGMRADFVILYIPRKILEVLGPFHDTPGQQLRDDRKWDARRREGYEVVTVRYDVGDMERAVLDAVGRPIV